VDHNEFSEKTVCQPVEAPKYMIKFFQDDKGWDVPYYRLEGGYDEWKLLPRNKHFYYDPVEDSEAYKSAAPVVQAEIDAKLEGEPYRLGMCHRVWGMKKRLLKERYGIDWHTPAEVNPDCHFD